VPAHRQPFPGDVPIIGQRGPKPHPPLVVQGPDGESYIVPVCIVLGVEQNTTAAIAATTAAIVIAEFEKRGVLPPRVEEAKDDAS